MESDVATRTMQCPNDMTMKMGEKQKRRHDDTIGDVATWRLFQGDLIYGRDNLSFEEVKGHLLSKDKLDNEFDSNSKSDRQTLVLAALRKRDKRCLYYNKLGNVKADYYKLRNKKVAESNEEI
ncbi:hypothetical protein J1N35_034172 [Gossypium stocksii]|uniref:Uncharacterized protein n=1 Tax=Gossypium stocksii TaxID=47602 RepID=A0A9D3ZQ62_9ROSI|nr:hypothetical protein J1N35_034172 [Gossypium stocksii]